MATGWAGDGAVQEQIDATIDDALQRAGRLGAGVEGMAQGIHADVRHPFAVVAQLDAKAVVAVLEGDADRICGSMQADAPAEHAGAVAGVGSGHGACRSVPRLPGG